MQEGTAEGGVAIVRGRQGATHERSGETLTTAGSSAGSAAQRDRRRRILQATLALASTGGFDAVQMRAVADRADVALGTLYRYFPSKIHLLVSAFAGQFEGIQETLARKPVPGDTPADRVVHVVEQVTRRMQADPHLTEALTRAFMFADASVTAQIHVVGIQLTTMLNRAIKGADFVEGAEPTAEEIAIARVIADVWLSALASWVTGRATTEQADEHLRTAVRLVLG